MPVFTQEYRNIFNAEAGAFSEVTDREATGDKSVTLDKFEKGVLHERYGLNSITRKGGGVPDGKPAEHVFNVLNARSGEFTARELALTHPKSVGNELRLYFRDGTGFYPPKNTVWFIFTRSGIAEPFIGYLPGDVWSNLTAGDELARQYEKDYSADEEDDEYQKAINSPKAQNGVVEVLVTKNRRDAALAARVIKEAKYVCQYEKEHETFVSASTGQCYFEAHHLIPISKKDLFEFSLDVEANIVSLCPNCHRLIHYSTPEEKTKMIEALFAQRKLDMEKCGIKVTCKDLLSYYGVNQGNRLL